MANRPIVLLDGKKPCSKCKQIKTASEFHKNAQSVSGLTSACKQCEALRSRAYKNTPAGRESNRRRTKRWAERHPDRARNALLKWNYGITIEEYARLEESQGGVCAICKNPERHVRNGKPVKLAVDHNHTTGAVRGLLCVLCNTLLGKIEADTDRFMQLLDYMNRNSQ